MSWNLYYHGQHVGSGIDDATKAHMVDMMETAAADGQIAWLATTHPDGDRLELAYTPGVPVMFINSNR
ncbi:hypothetical protein G7068_13575 [Leucobacter viscericola]|uniref:Uncharacterized protein n=1 Tax=Leucobacter viscericola TaxID=2714935 RepID=A0A6G7XI38_9MICO|nr:hypothetical protein [Leucobacter viscericola]QIK64109.1 hypothetical protein G7068_13575 [Leucobacter viscericola]